MKAFSIIFILIFSLSASAVTFTVTRSDDRFTSPCENTCSLREAVNSANLIDSDDVIRFAPDITTVTLSSGEIAINNNGTLAIQGSGANVLTISGSNAARIFYTNGANAAISGVTLADGIGVGFNNSGFGGAIYANGGSIALDGVHVTNNQTTNGDGGGVLFYGGSHSIQNSTFSANQGGSGCGAFGINNGSLQVINTTISGNSSGGRGGGFCAGNSNVVVRNSTITENTAITGGGFGLTSGNLTFSNTIVASNSAQSYTEIDFDSGVLLSEGNNLVGDSAGDAANTNQPITYQTSDVLDTNPMLGSLQNNGGTTPTRALLEGSPAIDKGGNTGAPAFDQRGMARILDGDGDGNAVIDIGAYEFLRATAATVSIGGRVTTAAGRGIANIFVTLTDSNGRSRATATNGFGFYRFPNSEAGATYIVSASGKSYRIASNSRVVSADGETAVDFIGERYK